MNWTLEHNGTEKSFAEWGFSHLTRRLVSQGTDEVTFIADGRAADAPGLFTPFADTVVIRRGRIRNSGGVWSGGTVWFSGIVIQAPRRGSASAESNSYKVAGPWWYLDTMVFEKTFNIFDRWTVAGNSATPPVYRQLTVSHCFLNLATTSPETPLGKQTTGQQIIEALEWALKPFVDAGAAPAFQIGEISPALDVPFDEVRDITCAEVIHKMLRWSPDAVTWFDYSTVPPTFHCKRRAELAPVALNLNAGNLIRELHVNPRHDLQSSYVLIRYEQVQSVDGVSWMIPVNDQWPEPLPSGALAGFNALRFTVDLQGAQTSTTTARLVCEDIRPDLQEWWLARHPQYKPFDPNAPPDASGPAGVADPNNPIVAFEIINGSVRREAAREELDLGYPRELVAGQLADWMNFHSQRITTSCKANIRHRNGHVVKEHPITYQCLATDGTTGVFSTTTVAAYAEPVPVGLARDIYDAISVLQYEGSLVLQEEEVSGGLSVGNLLNLTGGQLGEWTTMNALVQSVEENADTGTARVEFGPPANLSAGELVDLLRVNRNRLVHYSPNLMQTGTATAGGREIALGHHTPEKNSASTPGFVQRSVVSTNVDGSGALVVTDASDPLNLFTRWTTGPFDPAAPASTGSITIAVNDAEGHTMNIRKLKVCQNGVAGTMYFLCSGFIADA